MITEILSLDCEDVFDKKKGQSSLCRNPERRKKWSEGATQTLHKKTTVILSTAERFACESFCVVEGPYLTTTLTDNLTSAHKRHHRLSAEKPAPPDHKPPQKNNCHPERSSRRTPTSQRPS